MTIITARDAVVEGIRIHYLTAGTGPAVILLHGYTQTSRMWSPLIPQLAQRFTVIAPDLPGIGDSDIPQDGIESRPRLSAFTHLPSNSICRRHAWLATISD